jgi:uncharacterized coiled-coil DUF342 family protein
MELLKRLGTCNALLKKMNGLIKTNLSLTNCQKNMTTHIYLQQTVDELKKQIALYSSKFDSFQSAIDSSNKHFTEYKTQLSEYRDKLEDLTKAKIK